MKFTIYGNQEKRNGNPIGYHRTTQGSFWNAGSRRYKAWKDYVVASYDRAFNTATLSGKPIKTTEKMYLHTRIFFASGVRSDPDNIQKGIADALFENDKNLAGSYDFDFDKDNPRVEVEISIVPYHSTKLTSTGV